MKFRLYEYNVINVKEERDEFVIEFNNNSIMYNGETIIDKNKIEKITNLLNNYKDTIVKMNENHFENYKGGRQESFMIQFGDGDLLRVIGNTSSKEMSNLYHDLKRELTHILDE